DDNGNISMGDNIGGTGQDTIDEAIRHANDTANAGWNVSTNGDGEGENVAPGGKVDFSNNDGNIEIAQNGTDLKFDLADDIEVGNSITVAGGTTITGDKLTTT